MAAVVEKESGKIYGSDGGVSHWRETGRDNGQRNERRKGIDEGLT